MERYLGANLLGPGPRLMKKEFTGPRSHKGWETAVYVKFAESSSFASPCWQTGSCLASGSAATWIDDVTTKL